jgi:acyl-CoA thioester hydrolase
MNEVDLKDRDTFRVWTRDTIRFSDLDPNSHVNNGAINTYFEDGRVRFRDEHLSHLGSGMVSGFGIVKYTIEYHAMLHFPGEVEIGTTIVRIGSSSYTLGQAVFRDASCIATAHVITVRLSEETGRSMPLDESFKQALCAATGFAP